MKIVSAPSPNFDGRDGPPWAIVLHYTGMANAETALARLRDPGSKVSAHWLIDEAGTLHALVDEAARAWHAGRGRWRGQSDMNGASIGVELVNPGHEWGYRDFPRAQIETLLELLEAIRARWTIARADVIGHSDLAPDRKRDPGERFPWPKLAALGHALWTPRLLSDRHQCSREDPTPGLTALGYASDRFAPDELAIAFQRRHRPWRVDGRWDGECAARLRRLARAGR